MTENREKLVFHLFAYWHDPRWKNFVGATVKIRDLAQDLRDSGHEVVLFLPAYDFSSMKLSFRVVLIPIIDLPILRRVSFSIFLLMTLFVSFEKKKPDVVYVRRMASFIPALYTRIRKAIFLFEVNDDPYCRIYRGRTKSAKKIRAAFSVILDEINIRLSERSFVITSELKEKIAQRIRLKNSDRMIVSPSGANTRLFKPMPVHRCRSEIGLNPDQKYIGFVGTLLDHQGIDTLIDAAPKIKKECPKCRFLIVGEGPMKTRWQRMVLANGLNEDFMFVGQIEYEKVPIWINSMDVCVAPYLKSAGLRSPVKIFDYLACSRPVVASLLPGTTDLFSQPGAVCLVPPEDADQLAHALIGLLRNPEKADRMGRNGRELIVNHFDRMTNARRVIDVVNRSRSVN